MRLAPTILAAVLAVVSVSDQLRAGDSIEPAAPSASTTPAGTLLYLDQSRWRQADSAQKLALAADFMRIFCGNPAMPASILVGCLDNVEETGSIFERALSCVASDGGTASTARR
jgi:hypothetical protein